MKYNFDELVDRKHGVGSYSSKWSGGDHMKDMFQCDTVPEDRLCFFVADMDFKCPPEVVEAIKTTADHGIFGYTSTPDAYYDAVSRWMRDRFDLDVKKEQIICERGAHAAVIHAIEKLTKPGTGIIVPTPTYYYRNDCNCVGRYYVGCPMHNDNGYYTMDWNLFEKLCKEPQNSMVILMQPHNPTGRIWTEEEIKKFAEICRANDVIMLCDDVHMDFPRSGNKIVPFVNVIGTEDVVMITGLGKTFNLAGMAITNMFIWDEKLKEKMGQSHSMLSPFNVAACIAAYTKCDEWVDQLNAYLDETIDYALDRFHKELPKVKVWHPQGTYILWLDFTDCGYTEEELDKRIRGQAHIGLSDGKGMEPPEGTIFRRFCVTSPKSVVAEAMDRLVACLK